MPYVNEITLREKNLSLRYCQPLELFIYFGKGFRSFHAGNIGFVGQRAAKLAAVKVGGLKRSLPAGPGPSQQVCPGLVPGHGPIVLKV